MCGVFGLISKESENNLSFRKLAEIGPESIRRRGPDNNTLAFHRSGDFTMALHTHGCQYLDFLLTLTSLCIANAAVMR